MEPQVLLTGLSDPAAFPDAGPTVETVQTHISMVFLTGDRAYKVKKTLALWGFLDYSTIEKRRFYCEEEVRLNRRLAPEVYLGVLPVVRRDGRLGVGGEGEVVDWAVVMRRLPPGVTLRERIESGVAGAADVEAVAALLARFHGETDHGPSVARVGRPLSFARILSQNLRSTRASVPAVFPKSVHDALGARVADLLRRSRTRLGARARSGRVVEGHGDLRAEHAALLPTPAGPAWRVIDAIEFTPLLRCIDALSDMAFLSMDLASLGRRDLARAFEAAYLAARPDPDAEALLPLYLAYRAHVRAKVDAQRATEAEIPGRERARAVAGARRHLTLAWSYARRGLPPPLVVLVGPSGAGKSVIARALAPLLDAETIASDRVRKRLAGVPTTLRLAGAALAELYGPAMSERTYEALVEGGRRALAAGRPAILDATFLRRAARTAALDAARGLGCPAALVSVDVPAEVARARIEARARAGTDPSDATFDVYRAQVAGAEPFSAAETPHVVRHDGTRDPIDLLMPLLERLVAAAPRA